MNTRHPFLPCSQEGVSLVEILVALVISLILIAGMVRIFMGSEQTYGYQDALSRMQEDGRHAIEHLRRELRMVGYQGCGGPAMEVNDYRAAGSPDWKPRSMEGLRGFRAGDDHGLPVKPAEGTQSVSIALIRPTDLEFTGGDPPLLPTTEGQDGFARCEVVFAMDRNCRFANVFIAGAAPDTNVVNTEGTGDCGVRNEIPARGFRNDIKGSSAFTANAFIYYIRAGDDGEPALYRYAEDNQGGGVERELAAGVENMSIRYAVGDRPGRSDTVREYRSVDKVSDWSKVVAVRIELLMRSASDHVADEPQTYRFSGDEVTARDRRLRQVFSTTISFRNRLQ